MNSNSRKHDPAKWDCDLGPPQKRWRDRFAQWVMVGMLAVFSLGGITVPTITLAADDGSIINVMVVYTKEAYESMHMTEDDLKDKIGRIVHDVKTSFEESGVNPRLAEDENLVIKKTSYSDEEENPNPKIKEIWDDLITVDIDDIDDPMREIHLWRNEFLADVVILIVGKRHSGGCSYSEKLRVNDDYPNGDPNFKERAFAVVKVSCAEIPESNLGISPAFAYKLGHLMGCPDSDEVDNDKRYIMNNSFGSRINKWSDSCTTIINNTAHTVANFRSASILQFSNALQTVDEDAGTATLTVTRTDGAYGDISVDVSVSEESSASDGSDYVITSPTHLEWAASDTTNRTIDISIIDDDVAEETEINLENFEGTEFVKFTLGNITGKADLGDQDTTRITIKDYDGDDIAYVIDNTVSMTEEIAGIQKALTDYTQKIADQVSNGTRASAPSVNFTTFRDDILHWGTSNDLTKVQGWIDKLVVAGGDECPEASVQALNAVAPTLNNNTKILFVTDASPHPEMDIASTISNLRDKGIAVDVILTGDCVGATRRGDRQTDATTTRRSPRDGFRVIKSAREVYSRLAFETGGSFIYMPEVNDKTSLNATKFKHTIFNVMSGTDEPAVTYTAPNTALQGGTLDLVINASNTNFNDSSEVSLSGGIVVNGVQVLSATQLVANVTVSSDITPDFYDVNVTTRLGTETEIATGRGALQVITPRGWAEVLSVAPSMSVMGTTAVVEISGFSTNFDETSTVSFETGVTVQEITVQSPTLLTATINIAADAKAGWHRVLVRSGSQRSGKMNAFLVLPKEVTSDTAVSKVTTVTPAQAAKNSIVDIAIAGNATNFSEESFLDFSGNGIRVVSFDVISATQATATIAIENDAALGYRDVFVSTGDETANLLKGFEIAAEVPEIVQVNPIHGSLGETLELNITGQNVSFSAESVVNIEGTGITILSTTVISPTQVTANIQVSEATGIGWRNVSITTGSDIATLRDGFEIIPKPTPPQKDPVEELAKANLYLAWGQIVDELGNPIAGVTLQLGGQTATTDKAGIWYVYGIVEGNYTIVATKDDYTFTPKDVVLGNQEYITEVAMVPNPSGPNDYTVYGTIFNTDGKPLAGVTVQVGDQTVVTDENGQWEITGLSENKYSVVASKKAFTFAPQEVELGGNNPRIEVKITVGPSEPPPSYAVSGTITDTDGNKLAGVSVQINDGKTVVVTDAEGKWEITDLPKGNYTVTASKEGYIIAPKDFVVDGENVTLNLVIETPEGEYTAYGTIRDEVGNKLAGVTIQVAGQTVITDAAGNWEVPNLQEGEYIVIVSKEGYIFAPENVALGNDEFRQETVLVPLSKLKVKVVVEPRTIKQNDNVTYIATVINGGKETATGVVLTDVLPANAGGLISIETLDGGQCDADTITCTLPDLTSGNSARVKIVVSNTQAKSLLNTATVTANEYSADVQKTWKRVIPHLAASITDSPEPLQLPQPGEPRMLHYDVAATLSANAPSAATGVNLVMTLPKGVELQAVNSDFGMCDISNLPTINCQLTDLSVANADSVSHATVGVDVALKDAGLLALTLEAKVSANEYPVHTKKERTKIFIDPEYQVSLAFVIDDSGSMQSEIDEVKDAMTDFIDALGGKVAPMSVLLTFGDQVKYRAVTQDMTVLRNAIAKVKASGGGTCPEASFEAISFAIPHVKEGGTILFATDASPYEGSNVDDMVARLRSNGIIFNAMVFGDCANPESWNTLPIGSE